jgi:hypothetical protein
MMLCTVSLPIQLSDASMFPVGVQKRCQVPFLSLRTLAETKLLGRKREKLEVSDQQHRDD